MGQRLPPRHPLSASGRANSPGESSSKSQDIRHRLDSLQLNPLVLLDVTDQGPRPRFHCDGSKNTEPKCPEDSRLARQESAYGKVLLLHSR